jgi:hypothetical protein
MNKKELNITEYSLTFKEVTCIGVDWEKKIFIFLINGIEYIHEQKEDFSCSADTDHIRCAIDEFIEKKKEELFQREFFNNASEDTYRVIFFEQDNKIVSHTPVPSDWSDDILYDRLNNYNNSDEGRDKIAVCKIFPKSSYIGYLFEKMTEKKNYNKEAIQDAINALEEAKDFIYSLENL